MHVVLDEAALRRQIGGSEVITAQLAALGDIATWPCLRAAETLADMRHLPGRCHELHTNLSGFLSLDLDDPYRLLFRPAEGTDPGPGGGLDWSKVSAVTIVSVTDTHD